MAAAKTGRHKGVRTGRKLESKGYTKIEDIYVMFCVLTRVKMELLLEVEQEYLFNPLNTELNPICQ